jgi:hypothetical protein
MHRTCSADKSHNFFSKFLNLRSVLFLKHHQEIYRRRMNSNDKVHIGPLALPAGKEVLKPVTKLEKGPNGERILDMGNRGLMLNVITPLQKFSKGGATISDVLKQRFEDIFQREMSTELLQKTEDVFTKKKEVK